MILLAYGTITEEDLREFLFLHAVSLYAASTPGLFAVTRCESDVKKLLAHPAESY